jgi:hypothetical protein
MVTLSIPPYQAACPINTDVLSYVLAIARGDIDKNPIIKNRR